MQITRKEANFMFTKYWCPKCGAYTEMTPIRTHMPGILAQKCACGQGQQANFLEDDDDLITFPEGFKMPDNLKEMIIEDDEKLQQARVKAENERKLSGTELTSKEVNQ